MQPVENFLFFKSMIDDVLLMSKGGGCGQRVSFWVELEGKGENEDSNYSSPIL